METTLVADLALESMEVTNIFLLLSKQYAGAVSRPVSRQNR